MRRWGHLVERWDVRPGGLLLEHREAQTVVPRLEAGSVLSVSFEKGGCAAHHRLRALSAHR